MRVLMFGWEFPPFPGRRPRDRHARPGQGPPRPRHRGHAGGSLRRGGDRPAGPPAGERRGAAVRASARSESSRRCCRTPERKSTWCSRAPAGDVRRLGVRLQPVRRGRALCRGRRADRGGGAARPDRYPRLDHLRRRCPRARGLGQAARRAHPRDRIRPVRRPGKPRDPPPRARRDARGRPGHQQQRDAASAK